MGFFDKKDCALCGGKAGRFINYKLTGGEYMCTDCAERMSKYVDKISDMSLEEVQEHIRLKEENDERYRNEFEATRIFDTDGRHPLMAVDDNTGEFVILKEKNPTIFSFDQITNFMVDLNTKLMTEEERKKVSNLNSIIDFFLSDDFGSRYPDLPRCTPGFKVTGMYFNIRFGPNPFRVSTVKMDMLPNWSNSKSEIEKGYRCADEIYQCIKEYKENGGGYGRNVNRNKDNSEETDASDAVEQVRKLKELLDDGILTQEEFDTKKRQLLGL